MHTPGQTAFALSPDLARFTALRERWAGLIAPVEVDLPGLGRRARVTCSPKSGTEVSVTYVGVSERGQDLSWQGVAGLDRPDAGPRAWDLRRPGFHVPDDPDCLVGPSEGMRIDDAVAAAVAAYLDAHPQALPARAALAAERRAAMQAARARSLELELGAAREVAERARVEAERLAAALDAALDTGLDAAHGENPDEDPAPAGPRV